MRFHPNDPRNFIGYLACKNLSFQQIASDVVEKLVGISFNFQYTRYQQEVTIYEGPNCLVKVELNHKKNINIINYGDESGSVQIENNIIINRRGRLSFESTMQLPFADFGLNSPKITFKFKDIIENGTISYSILPRELQIEVYVEDKKNYESGTITLRIISKMNNFNGPPPIPQTYSQGLQMQCNNGPNPALLGNPSFGSFPKYNMNLNNGPQANNLNNGPQVNSLNNGPQVNNLSNGSQFGNAPPLGSGPQLGSGPPLGSGFGRPLGFGGGFPLKFI